MLENIDQEMWIYIGIIFFVVIFLLWMRFKNKKRDKSSFRRRYQERKEGKK